MQFGLKDTTIEKINSVFAKYANIEKVIVYGSRAKGNFKNGSDIDLTIIGKITRRELSNIYNEIDDLMLPYMIDLSIFTDISNSDLVEHINRVGLIFYEKK